MVQYVADGSYAGAHWWAERILGCEYPFLTIHAGPPGSIAQVNWYGEAPDLSPALVRVIVERGTGLGCGAYRAGCQPAGQEGVAAAA